MNAVLNAAANVSKYYSEKADEAEIRILAFMARENTLDAMTATRSKSCPWLRMRPERRPAQKH